MITTEQLREAVDSYDDGWDTNADEGILLAFAREELARRESERVDRETPIDARWCEANGGRRIGGFVAYRWQVEKRGVLLDVEWVEHNGVSISDTDTERIDLPWITCSGQLLDLIRALKGGA